MTPALRLRAAEMGRKWALGMVSYFNAVIAECLKGAPNKPSTLRARDAVQPKRDAFRRARDEWRGKA